MLFGYAAGTGIGPTAHQHGGAPGAHTHGPSAGPHSHGAVDVGGLSSSAGGYTLAVESPVRQVGVSQPLRFTIRGPDGSVVTRYDLVHDRRLHLIVARADLTGYQHLHPSLDTDGTWSVPLTLPTPGTWRVYADFATVAASGERFAGTLGATLAVAGEYVPAPLPAPADSTEVDGLPVRREGAVRAGVSSPLLLRVPVPNLERYLGAYGHLVVLRASDGAYLHVHPDDQLVDGAVRFWVEPPGPGSYRAFFDFSVGGTVRTAEFTLSV